MGIFSTNFYRCQCSAPPRIAFAECVGNELFFQVVEVVSITSRTIPVRTIVAFPFRIDGDTPSQPTRFTRSTRLIFPEALAEESEQIGVPTLSTTALEKADEPSALPEGRGSVRLEATPPWEGRAPARPPRARCPRPQGRPNAVRHFLDNAPSSDHQPSEQPGNRTSDH